MLRSYIIVALRNLSRQKIYSFINIAGLAIGLAACILIILYIRHEVSYDRFHDRSDNIYRIAMKGRIGEDFLNVAVTSPALCEPLMESLPEVEHVTRISDNPQTVYFTYGDKKFYEEDIFYVDSSFFHIFSFKLISGLPSNVLKDPYSMVLTESVAQRYFGNEDPIGKVLRLNDRYNYTITGVCEDVPSNSHFRFNFVSSFSTLYEVNGRENYQNWGSLSLHTYVLLKETTDPKVFQVKLNGFLDQFMGDLKEMANVYMEAYLQPISMIHLHSNLMAEIDSNSDISYVYTFAAIALFIILIAGINFMNLSTARSIKRSREVGMRKVVGAYRLQLIQQFLGESIIFSLIAMVIALIIVELFLPAFNTFFEYDIQLNVFKDPLLLFGIVLMTLLIGILAGLYPAFYLSAFQPIYVIKGLPSAKSKKSNLRNTLVIIQFSISIFLIIATGLLYSQINYLQSRKIGFEKENTVIIPIRGQRLREKAESLSKEFKNLSCVKNVSCSRFVPGRDMDGTGYIPEGMDENTPWIIFTNYVDYDYISTLGMNIIHGRDFNRNYATDTASIIINETLWKKLGWEDPLHKNIIAFRNDTSIKMKIIGVIEDYHFESLHDVVEPCLLMLVPEASRYMNIKLHPGNLKSNMELLEKKWTKLEHSFPFDYYFLDKDLDQMYSAEVKLGRLFIYFTIVAIIIACLGLFGLSSYNAEQRTKEIGIRKAMGASVESIIVQLSIQFAKFVVLANIIAWPLAWYFMDYWLQDFAYRIDIYRYWFVFLAGALSAFIIAVITVGFQSVRAARANPVDALKYE